MKTEFDPFISEWKSYVTNSKLNLVEKCLKLAQILEYPNLDIKQDWPRILSLGEQQRLAFARLLLNSPRFAVLDEATSALDIDTEKKLLDDLFELRGQLTLIVVTHRTNILRNFDKIFSIKNNEALDYQDNLKHD